MAGTTWPTLTAGAKAKASEVESKFDWAEEDIVPHAAGTKTDATYDLGESSFRFRNAYNSGFVTVGSGTVASNSLQNTGDAGSGLFYPSTTQLAVSFAGTEAARFTSGPALGIGVTSFAAGTILEMNKNDGSNLVAIILGNANTAQGTRSILNADTVTFISYAMGSTRAGNWWSGGPAQADSVAFQCGSEANVVWDVDGNSFYWRGAGNTTLTHVSNTTETWKNTNGVITQPLQPSFLALNSADDGSVTGDGTTITVEFDTEVYDLNADFNNTTDTFTAPVTGKYNFEVCVSLTGLNTTVHTSAVITLVTSNRTFRVDIQNGAGLAHLSQTFNVNIIADMDSSDTALVQAVSAGAVLNVGVEGSSDPAVTFFSGSLIN